MTAFKVFAFVSQRTSFFLRLLALIFGSSCGRRCYWMESFSYRYSMHRTLQRRDINEACGAPRTTFPTIIKSTFTNYYEFVSLWVCVCAFQIKSCLSRGRTRTRLHLRAPKTGAAKLNNFFPVPLKWKFLCDTSKLCILWQTIKSNLTNKWDMEYYAQAKKGRAATLAAFSTYHASEESSQRAIYYLSHEEQRSFRFNGQFRMYSYWFLFC